MRLAEAERIAKEITDKLSPYCSKIQTAGSVRRCRPFPRDIDFVLIPNDLWNLQHQIAGLGPVKMSGTKIQRVMVGNTQVDLYLCGPETWGITLLVRTGSESHNIKLASRAKRLGLHFAVSRGIENEKGQVIASQTEEEVFRALGLNYIPPEGRE